MNTPLRRRHASRRLGDDYQDIIGVKYICEMLKYPRSIEWITFEAPDGRFLDDIQVQRPDSRDYIQVKYAVESNQTWSLDDLTRAKSDSATSLLRKWAESWLSAQNYGRAYRLFVVTNRRPEETLKSVMTTSADGAHCIIEYAALGTLSDEILRATGLTEEQCKGFLSELNLSFDQPDLESLRTDIRLQMSDLGVTDIGWESLLNTVARWAVYQEPEPDGKIRIGDIRVACRLWDPYESGLSQDFPGDAIIHVFRRSQIDAITREINTSECGCYLVEGKPGTGKSCLLSSIVGQYSSERPKREDHIEYAVRHHCYLSVTDPSYNERTRFQIAAKDLMRQLYRFYSNDLHASTSKSLQVANPSPECLSEWLRVCASAATGRSKKLLVVLDGLDHIVSEHALKEAKQLLTLIPTPLPPGLFILMGTQPVANLLPSPLRQVLSKTIPVAGFTRDETAQYSEAYLGEQLDGRTLDLLRDRSEGNPLYLRYILERARIEGKPTETWLTLLPSYGGDIEYYYGRLWEGLSPAAKTLLAVCALASFPILSQDIAVILQDMRESASVIAEAQESVRHLLNTHSSHSHIYHPSFKSFVSEQSHTRTIRAIVLGSLHDYINRHGDEFLRWAHSWEYAYLRNDPQPLLNGVTRDWVVDSLARLRPLNWIIHLTRLAINAARDNKDISEIVRKGRLLSLLLRHDDAETSDAVAYVRKACIVTNGAVATAPIAFSIYGKWGNLSIRWLGKEAAVERAFDVSSRVFEETAERFNRLEQRQSMDVRSLYHSAACCADIPPARVLEHYRQYRSANSTEWDGHWREYLLGLAEGNIQQHLLQLLTRTDLEACELDPLAESYAMWVSRWGTVGELPQALVDRYQHIDNPYLAVCWLLSGKEVNRSNSSLGCESLPAVLDSQVPRYSDDKGWTANYRRIFWTILVHALNADQDVIDQYRLRVSSQNDLRRRTILAIVELGELAAIWIRGQPLDMDRIIEDISELRPLSHSFDDDFFNLLHNNWLGLLSSAIRLGLSKGCTLSISESTVRHLWDSAACSQLEILEWLADLGLGQMESSAHVSIVEWLGIRIESYRGYIEEKPAYFSRLAVVAAVAGLHDEAVHLAKRCYDNLLGYGSEKDPSLHNLMTCMTCAADHGYDRIQKDIVTLVPIVFQMDEFAGGARTYTRRLFEIMSRHASTFMIAYLVRLLEKREWACFEECLPVYISQLDFSNPVMRAIAVSPTSYDALRATKELWERYLAMMRETHPVKATTEGQLYDEWMTRDMPREYREEAHDPYDDAHEPPTHDIQHDSPIPARPAELLDGLLHESFEITYENRNQVASAITSWYVGSTSYGTESLKELAAWWLRSGDGFFRSEVGDALWKACLHSGLMELTYRLLVRAQADGRGWSSSWTSPQLYEDREAAIVMHFYPKARDFLLESLSGDHMRYGIEETSRICEFLCKTGHKDLAFTICREQVEDTVRCPRIMYQMS